MAPTLAKDGHLRPQEFSRVLEHFHLTDMRHRKNIPYLHKVVPGKPQQDYASRIRKQPHFDAPQKRTPHIDRAVASLPHLKSIETWPPMGEIAECPVERTNPSLLALTILLLEKLPQPSCRKSVLQVVA